MTNLKRIAFYVRSATGNLADLNRQIKNLDKEMIGRGFDPAVYGVAVYRDTHQSGLHPGPEFERMYADLMAGKIDVVMVSRMNRISRKLTSLLAFQNLVNSHGIRFISTHENVDSIHWQSSGRPFPKPQTPTQKGIALSRSPYVHH